jgi:hypothetical protein
VTFEELIASHSAEVQAIALSARDLVLSVFPEAVEQVDPPDHLIAYGRGTNMGEQLWYIAPFKAHVNLGFMRGTDQEDPAGLLEGTGKRLRHVKLRSLADVERPALRTLVESSYDLLTQ